MIHSITCITVAVTLACSFTERYFQCHILVWFIDGCNRYYQPCQRAFWVLKVSNTTSPFHVHLWIKVFWGMQRGRLQTHLSKFAESMTNYKCAEKSWNIRLVHLILPLLVITSSMPRLFLKQMNKLEGWRKQGIQQRCLEILIITKDHY